MITPYVPEYITVHLGKPDSPAQNVTLSFPEYIKNVASSELYPTWPEAALRANIYAQISVALNRVYTEWYRSRGYNFDITNSTQYDQSFVYGRDVFDNVSLIVDDIFDNYIVKGERLEPLYAQYCDGRKVKCDGLSQWGSVDLAKQGYTPVEILKYYYGDNIDIMEDTPIKGIQNSYPGAPLRLGDTGADVIIIQSELNRISSNYPNIPKIYPINGVFDEVTESAVKEFQRTFNLTPDGIVGKGTWYKLIYLYIAVKNLAELSSEGIILNDISKEYQEPLKEGDRVRGVRLVQYYLDVVAAYYAVVPRVVIDGYFGPETKSSVIAFQKLKDIPVTGVVDQITWDTLYQTVLDIFTTIPPSSVYYPSFEYPGYILKRGMSGPSVLNIQQYLAYISEIIPSIPKVKPDGVFGAQTEAAVIAFQKEFGLTPDGLVGEITWNKIVDTYTDFRFAERRKTGQYPGSELKEGSSDSSTIAEVS